MVMEPRMIQYYMRQGIFTLDELSTIKSTLETPLPSCFRINENAEDATRIKQTLAQCLSQFQGAAYDGKAVNPPHPLSWYPVHHGAWQLDIGKNVLGKVARDHEGVRVFRDFLLLETAKGNITRQEAVSMIPALLLDIQRQHIVLDLCAAPGSKTSQVMESLGSHDSNFTISSGFIVANDANEKRGYMLVHQLQRLGMDTAVVTCHLGQKFPGLWQSNPTGNGGMLMKTSAFDRILCDVPCTGDATVRKNANIWRQWVPGGALTLHQVQLELALRAAALLKTNGLMAYSTCSFNPLENEAVVAELLRRSDGALELVDISTMLPGLIRRSGRSQWSVAWMKKDHGAELEWFDTYDNVPTALKGLRIIRSMFPPSSSSIRESLQHCMRLFPTDHNTGGFFVALLRKKHSLPGGSLESGLPSYETVTPRRPHGDQSDFVCQLCGALTHTVRHCSLSRNAKIEAAKRQQEEEQATSANELNVVPLHGYTKLAAEHWVMIKEFYGITESFPSTKLCSRSDGATTICLVNENVQDACLVGNQLKVLNTGVRVFAKVNSSQQHHFRPTEEGLAFLLPYMTKRKLLVPVSDLLLLLNNAVGSAVALDLCSSELQIGCARTLESGGVGPIVLVLASEISHSRSFAVPVRMGRQNISLLVDKTVQQELREILQRIVPSTL